MLKVLAVAAVCLVLAVAAVLAYAATRPGAFRVTRSATIKAPPDRVFALISDFKQWPAWSPWEQKDPAMKRTLGAVTSGTGAVYEWSGDKNVGSGRMTIADAAPASKVAIKLDMLTPFEAHNDVVFSLAPQGEATVVNWDMQGPVPFVAKIVHLFFNMDKMVGGDFETGLANLKTAAESR
ncbi:MAG: SRPBCC family protein [Pseudolabrys sp.]